MGGIKCKMNQLWKQFYFLPVLVLVPIKGIQGICEGYKAYNGQSLSCHVVGCFVNAYGRAVEGAFLGVVWPLSLPIAIKRYFDSR